MPEAQQDRGWAGRNSSVKVGSEGNIQLQRANPPETSKIKNFLKWSSTDDCGSLLAGRDSFLLFCAPSSVKLVGNVKGWSLEAQENGKHNEKSRSLLTNAGDAMARREKQSR